MTNTDPIREFWWQACDALALPADSTLPAAWAFGDSPEMADELLALVLDRTKTATAGALWEHEAKEESLPQVGMLSIVLDGSGAPACVVETTEVMVKPMTEVDAAFAYDEGEGDRTLAWWREEHESFFCRFLPTLGLAFAPDMPLVLQRFVVRYARD